MKTERRESLETINVTAEPMVPWRRPMSEREVKDKRWALVPLGLNSRLTHNRLYPGRPAAAT